MAGVNKVILVGNLGRDPEIRHLEGGAVVANFTLATTEFYKDKTGNRIEQTEWHNVVLWRGLAEIAEKYLRKGMSIYLEGKIRTSSWEDKDGTKKYKTEIVGETMTMLGGKRDDNQSPQQQQQTQAPSFTQNSQSAPATYPESTGSPISSEPEDLPF